jgi:prepilin-type N-terminal cleavage/methylation domain-containing protein/prepilin-type processing-associated H-X9-DG protein
MHWRTKTVSRRARRTVRTGPDAFTLTELLVVISIIGLLMAILMPSFGAIREMGRSTDCKNNLQILTAAVMQYSWNAVNKDYLPMGAYGGGTWATLLLKGHLVDPPPLSNSASAVLPGRSVFRCPAGQGSEVDGANAQASGDANRPFLHNWYGANGASGGDPNKYLMNLNRSVQTSNVTRKGQTIMLYDGVGLHDVKAAKVTSRHMGTKTNVAFLDAHGGADTLDRQSPTVFPTDIMTNPNLTPRFAIK